MKPGTFTMGLTLIAAAMLAGAQTPDPQSAASEHQKAVTGQKNSQPPPTPDSSSPAAAASPHQKSVTGQKNLSGSAAFVMQASQANMAEVELSKTAASKATDPRLKSFASEMIKDHKKAQAELKSIADSKGLSVPASLDQEHAAKLRELNQKGGNAFDQAYQQQMVADHEQATALFEQEANAADSKLASFAGKTLPTLKHHQEMIAQLGRSTR